MIFDSSSTKGLIKSLLNYIVDIAI